jgi:hypothetical protein
MLLLIAAGCGGGPIALGIKALSGGGSSSENAPAFVFRTSSTIDVGELPFAAAVGDLNRDGRADIVVANQDDNNLSVLIANGPMTFDPPVIYGCGNSPVSVVLADFSRDGNLDVVTANYGSDSISYLEGSASGVLDLTPVSVAVSAGPRSMAVADVDDNGILDLAVGCIGNGANSTVRILKWDVAAPPFTLLNSYSVSLTPASIAVGDFNRDGNVDLATANTDTDTVSIALGATGGLFFPPVMSSKTVGDRPQRIATGDFDRDGNLDLSVVNDGNATVSILMGDGLGGFSPSVVVEVGASPFGQALADFDGDGWLDLAIGCTTDDTVWVLAGSAGGTFNKASRFLVGPAPFDVVACDFDGDGKVDLGTADSRGGDPAGGSITVLANSTHLSSRGRFSHAVAYAAGTSPTSIAAADLDRDGVADLAVNDPVASVVSILLGNGDGTFPSRITSPMLADGPQFLLISDINDNGVPDLATCDGTSTNVYVMLGLSGGSFGAPALSTVPLAPRMFAVADLDGDTVGDLVTANEGNDSISTRRGAGNTFGPGGGSSDFAVQDRPRCIAAADLNHDGKQDFIVGNAGSDSVTCVAGNTNLSLSVIDHHSSGGTEPLSIAVGDFDRNGWDDVAMVNGGDPPNNAANVAIRLGQGAGAFGAFVPTDLHDGAISVATADLDSDGTLDLAISCFDTNEVAVLFGAGDGTFGGPTYYSVPAGPSGLAISDLDADGRPDIAVACQLADSVAVLMNR